MLGFLSVGAEGCVLSFEVSPTHLKIARRNVAEWAESWDLSHPEQREKWPDNVRFHSAGVQEAQGLIDCAAVDAVSSLYHSHRQFVTLKKNHQVKIEILPAGRGVGFGVGGGEGGGG